MPEAILSFANTRSAVGDHAVRGGHRPASGRPEVKIAQLCSGAPPERGSVTHVGAELLFGHVLLNLECFRFGLRSVAALT